MIEKHPLIDDTNFDVLLDREISSLDISGYKSDKVLRALFNLFTWQYIEGNIANAGIDPRIKSFFDNYDLSVFEGDSIAYSAIVLYNILSKEIDIRSLEKLQLVYAGDGNKVLQGEDFSYPELRDLYLNNAGDLSDDFLLFNDIFKQREEKEVNMIKSYGQITRANSLIDLVKPDLSYKLASKQLLVDDQITIEDSSDNVLYVLQDCTYSIKEFVPAVNMVKAFILERAFEHNYSVHWLYVNTSIQDRVHYTKENINEARLGFDIQGTSVNTSQILTEDEFINKEVVIITDGTDDFNFPFNTKTKKINVVSFIDNNQIKDKISNYGRFFKVKL